MLQSSFVYKLNMLQTQLHFEFFFVIVEYEQRTTNMTKTFYTKSISQIIFKVCQTSILVNLDSNLLSLKSFVK